ncbi:hypothetical protein ACFL20_13425 [Spirochaetota bacterium]
MICQCKKSDEQDVLMALRDASRATQDRMCEKASACFNRQKLNILLSF